MSSELTVQEPINTMPQASTEGLLRDIETISGGDPSVALKLVWPIWRKTDSLKISQLAISCCAANFDWTFDPEAEAIARRIAEVYLIFPEFSSNFTAPDLADRVAKFGPEEAAHHTLLAALIDPTNIKWTEKLAVAASAPGGERALPLLLERLADSPNRDVVVAQVAKSYQERAASIPLTILKQMGELLSKPKTLARLLVEDAISDAIGGAPGRSFDRLQMAGAIQQLQKIPKPSLPRRDRASGVDLEVEARISMLERLMKRLEPTLQPLKASHTSHQVASNDMQGTETSGIVSWLELIAKHESVHIPAARFRTTYAQRAADGTLFSDSHPPKEVLQYGPYISLPAGVYSISFFGKVDHNTKVGYFVASAFGEITLASNVQVGQKDDSDSTLVAQLTFALSNGVEGVEFIIRPLSPDGLIRSTGIGIQWSPW